MTQKSIISMARVALVALLMTVFLPLFGATESKALTAGELNFTYSSDGGITYGDGSAWNRWNSQDTAWTKVFTEYKGVIMGVSGIATLTMVILFIINFIKLGKSADNPNTRSQALGGLLWTGIAAAGAGGVTLFVGIFSNILTKS
jgi:hypothetical protein